MARKFHLDVLVCNITMAHKVFMINPQKTLTNIFKCVCSKLGIIEPGKCRWHIQKFGLLYRLAQSNPDSYSTMRARMRLSQSVISKFAQFFYVENLNYRVRQQYLPPL